MWQFKEVSQIHRNNDISLDKQALSKQQECTL